MKAQRHSKSPPDAKKLAAEQLAQSQENARQIADLCKQASILRFHDRDEPLNENLGAEK